MFNLFKNTKETNDVNTLIRRVYRNKLKIKEHLAMAIFASFFIISMIITKKIESDNIPAFILLVSLVIIGDFLMILWHRYWIRKWREQLTVITGLDYTRLDKKPEDGVSLNELTKENYDMFFAGLLPIEQETIEKAQKKEQRLSLLEKATMSSLEAKFKLFLENRAIMCFVKLQDINPKELTTSIVKKGKKGKKSRK